MHYGTEYFSWQKTIGEFGGHANLFKFLPYIKREDSVLDFGCGGGYLLQNIDCATKIGIEINPVARGQAEELGLTVYDDVREVRDDFATLVISNHALEHTECPLEVLRSIFPKICKNGKIVFVVPHQTPSERYDEKDINQHLYTWNPPTLGNLFKAAGYVHIRVDVIRDAWPPYYRQIHRLVGEKCFQLLSHACALLRGNYELRAIARKP